MGYYLGKWTKHKLLAQSGLAAALPATGKMTEETFWNFLKQYKKVIVKPSTGSGGAGVMEVSALGRGHYQLHYGMNQKTFQDQKTMYDFLQRKMQGKTHIVQQKISLATVENRPFDIRVMVQRKRKTDWTVTGSLAKIAGSGYIITNVARSKGMVVPLSTAIQNSNIQPKSEQRMIDLIHSLSLQATKQLHTYYPWIHTVGLDIGLDQHGKPWIIEANFTPNQKLFLRLKDKTMYKRILAYAPQKK